MAIAIGDSQFGIEAVGTAEHQDELELIAGPRTESGVDHLCGALLVPDPKNPYDANAIAVVISSRVVGYIPSNIAPSLKYAMRVGGFIAAGCAARIVGGWGAVVGVAAPSPGRAGPRRPPGPLPHSRRPANRPRIGPAGAATFPVA